MGKESARPSITEKKEETIRKVGTKRISRRDQVETKSRCTSNSSQNQTINAQPPTPTHPTPQDTHQYSLNTSYLSIPFDINLPSYLFTYATYATPTNEKHPTKKKPSSVSKQADRVTQIRLDSIIQYGKGSRLISYSYYSGSLSCLLFSQNLESSSLWTCRPCQLLQNVLQKSPRAPQFYHPISSFSLFLSLLSFWSDASIRKKRTT